MTVKAMLQKFGQDITCKGADGWSSETYGGFIQPLRYKNKMYLNGVNTVIGFNSQGHYLYIGPSDHDVTKLPEESWIESGGKKFTVDRAEKVYLKNEVVYVWAIIREIVEVD